MSQAARPQREVPAVVNAMRILDLLSIRESARATDIRTVLGLNASTCHDTLKTLVVGGFAAYDPTERSYSLGPASVALGVRACQRSNLLARARPEMRNWVRLTGFTAFITCPLPDWSSVIVDKVEGTMPLRVTVEVGDRFPADAGAIGKVFLAYLTEAERALLNVQLTRYTEHSISNRDNWATELSTISLRGWSDSRGEYYAGGNAVAAPVFGPLGDVVAVMGSLAATTQLRDEDLPRLGPVMADSAQRISSELSA